MRRGEGNSEKRWRAGRRRGDKKWKRRLKRGKGKGEERRRGQKRRGDQGRAEERRGNIERSNRYKSRIIICFIILNANVPVGHLMICTE